MRALEIVRHGHPLQEVDLPDPEAGAGEVVVAIRAAGICRSDVHYRSGTRPVANLPLVPGHEIAGTVSAVGDGVSSHRVGDRVALHYLVSCGSCSQCVTGAEQFCETGAMLGLDRQGGYAEAIVVPAVNARPVPDVVSFEAAAVMMCSSATSLHALRRGSLQSGDVVGVFGAGGLGMSTVVLARALGAGRVLAMDVNPVKLAAAAAAGAEPVDVSTDPVAAVRALAPTGIDLGVELVGSASVMETIVRTLAPGGRGVAVGITNAEFGLNPYRDLIGREVDLLGSADHLVGEVDELLAMAAAGTIDIGGFVTNRVPLDGGSVDAALDRLEEFGDDIRTVIVVG